MLYLKHPNDAADDSSQRRVPVADRTASRFEFALLVSDRATRQQEVAALLADDHEVSLWALRRAEQQLGRTINRVEEAAEWLAEDLESELAASLVSDRDVKSSVNDVEWRLPSIVSKLHACERQLRDFDARLEYEKLESLKELAYGASHEINNPLANIAARAQTLLEEESDPERVRKLQTIYRQAMRAHEMIADLMLFARPPKLKAGPVDLQSLLVKLTAELSELATEHEVKLACDAGVEPLELLADKTQLGVAIRAVVVNAMQAATGGGHVSVNAREVELDARPHAEVSVRDDGPGISEEVRRHMFDPFFSGREAGRGLGFGLTKCWRIVTDHGGQIVVDRPSGGGAEIAIFLPLSASMATLP